MRVMIFAKSQPGAENPPNPTPEAMQAFWKFNEELVAAGGCEGPFRGDIPDRDRRPVH